MRTSPIDDGFAAFGRAGVAAEAPPGRFAIASASVGSLFPVFPFAFTVHSIFRSALNLKPAYDSPLLSLVSDMRHAHPRGVVVPNARFDSWALVPGVSGGFDGEGLSFASFVAPRVSVGSARDAEKETLSSSVPIDAPSAESVARAVSLVLAARAEKGSDPLVFGRSDGRVSGTAAVVPAASPEPAFIQPLRKAASSLARAFSERSLVDALRAAEGLVGLGSGLTPSGDDFLCGFLASRRALSASGDRDGRFLDKWGHNFLSTETGFLGRTNDISAAFLSSAAEGRFSAALCAFARSVVPVVPNGGDGEGGWDEIAVSVSMLSSIGHGSGLDSAEGFLYGLSSRLGRLHDE